MTRGRSPAATSAAVAPDLAVLIVGRPRLGGNAIQWRTVKATGDRPCTGAQARVSEAANGAVGRLVRALLCRSKLLMRKPLAPCGNP